MALELEGRVALITGAAQGMGRAVAERMGGAGARLVLNDRNPQTLRATAATLERKAVELEAVAGDVSSGRDVARMVEQALERFGAIHILVNNAGVLRPTPVIEIEEEEWDWVLNVNLKGTYLCSRAVLPAMRREGWGRIVNFSSTAGKNVSTLGGAHYTASKAGVLGFTRHLAKEEAPARDYGQRGLSRTHRHRDGAGHHRLGADSILRPQLPRLPSREARRGRRAGGLSGLGSSGLHHRGFTGHQRGRPDDLISGDSK